MPCVNVAHHRRAKASYKAAHSEKVKARRQAKQAIRTAKREQKIARRAQKHAQRPAKAQQNAKLAPISPVEVQSEVKEPTTVKKARPVNPDDPQLLKDGAYIQIQPRDTRRHRAKPAAKIAPVATQAAQNAQSVAAQSVAKATTQHASAAPATNVMQPTSTPQSQATAQTSTHGAKPRTKQPNLRTELKRTAKRQAKIAKRQTKQALKAQQKAIKQQAKTAKLQLKVAKQQAKQLGYLPVAAPVVHLNLGTKQLRRRPSRAELINAESRLGSTLFGPIPAGHRREFFHDQQNVWIWHEGWVDQGRHARQLTVRYEVRPTGVYKKVSSGSYLKLEGHELENFRRATHAYLSLIKRNIYRYAPTAPTQVA